MTEAVRVALDVTGEEDGERLDRLIAGRVADISRSYAQNLVKQGDVLVNGAAAKPAARVRAGDRVEVALPPVGQPEELTPYHFPVPVIYEDDDVIVFDKPAGLVVHPAPGHEHGTLANIIRSLRPDLELVKSQRPGIVHRLDKDTSGLIVVAKNEAARLYLLKQWQNRDVIKRYTTLVNGVVAEDEGTIDAPIGRDPNNRKRMWVVAKGRPAVTHFRAMRRFADATLLDVQIVTGRTHQIRVHMAFIGHPVIGDQTYGKRPFRYPVERQFLHASYLRFFLPGGHPIALETPLPPDLQAVLTALESERARGS
ncbi:MAG TPA: RluA family pseudouridine synthase [Nitrolancea sp.]|nr:RluA family pseudouridine synthase [Nitrolancea sp.]